MQITIHDETCRRVVLFAIWQRAATGVSEHFYDQLTDEAESAINPGNDAPGVLITDGVTLLTATLLDVEPQKRQRLATNSNSQCPPKRCGMR